jgi:hypothetical protein
MNNTIDLDKNFFMGGNATFTVDNGKGTHYTFKIRQPKEAGAGYTSRPHFVKLLTGPDNTSNYTYMGIVDETHPTPDQTRLTVRLTAKSRYTDDSTPVKVLRWVLLHAMTDRILPEGYAVHHEGKCGCCGRKLTHPVSLTVGIGPECAKRLGLTWAA